MSLNKKLILEMDYKEAKNFFMKEKSYCPLQLPEYFTFEEVLKKADDRLKKRNSISKESFEKIDVSSIEIDDKDKKEYNTSNINCKVIYNKNGKYDWRPIEFVHPIVYVDLVNTITAEKNWEKLKKMFKYFSCNKSIKCISMPLEATVIHDNDTKETILNWWNEFEQRSIELALEYTYCIQTDITNCYGSIYTHSIAWAIEGKDNAKKNRNNKDLLGNQIDKKIRNLQYGQTNGIPQGGALFDFIAEVVLGYADNELSKKLKGCKNYQIIRYRDDYRIFTNDKEELNFIVKQLSDTLSELNMHFNSQKTKYTTDLIGSAIKPDKLYWNSRKIAIFSENKEANGKRKQSSNTLEKEENKNENKENIKDKDKSKKVVNLNYHMSLQKHLLEIYILSEKFPNSGSIKRAFSEFIDRLYEVDKLPSDYEQLISITANIIVSNPNSIPQGIAIISYIFKLMLKDNSFIDGTTNDVKTFIDKILHKLHAMPNCDYAEIWLQRISVTINKKYKNYNSPLCEKVINKKCKIWNSSWIKKGFDENSVIDTNKLNSVNLEIPKEAVNTFTDLYY